MTRHKVTILICLITLIGFGYYAKHSYDHYQAKQAETTATAKTAELKQAQIKQKAFDNGIKLDEAQCAKDFQAYNLLPQSVKAKTAAPNCETLIQ